MQIYKITNLINNRIYIGLDSKNRNYYFGSGILIKFAIKKYGKKNFKKEILEECKTKEELCEKEKFWIKKLNSQYPIGYNISSGGEFGDSLSHHPRKNEIFRNRSKDNPDMYKKVSKSLFDYYENNPITQERKDKISKGAKKRHVEFPFTKEQIDKISINVKKAMKNPKVRSKLSKSTKNLWKNDEYRKKQLLNRPDKFGKNNPMFGKKQTDESNEKNRIAHMGKIPWNKGLTKETDKRLNKNSKLKK